MRGRSKREGIYVYIQMIHFVIQQKVTQHCKATIPQLKKKKEEEKEGNRNTHTHIMYLLIPKKKGKNKN